MIDKIEIKYQVWKEGIWYDVEDEPSEVVWAVLRDYPMRILPRTDYIRLARAVRVVGDMSKDEILGLLDFVNYSQSMRREINRVADYLGLSGKVSHVLTPIFAKFFAIGIVFAEEVRTSLGSLPPITSKKGES